MVPIADARMRAQLPNPIIPGQPLTALAPMQDVTTLPFMKVISHYGCPDYFFTEYFRVHVNSTLEKHILTSITENKSGRPVFAQMIGENLEHLERTVKDLLQYPVAGIDLNMGCPAPKVYKKNVGGGLLRNVSKVNEIFALLRQTIPGLFTVKMRVGFENTENFEAILDLINKHKVDLLSLHGRTVKAGYRGEVDYEKIRQAVLHANCPVFANGNIATAKQAITVLKKTEAFGVMIGRAAIRNPWIFQQIRDLQLGTTPPSPTLGMVHQYIHKLYEETKSDGMEERPHVNYLKKFLNFIGQSVDKDGHFLHQMRRSQSYEQLFDICHAHLVRDGRENTPFPDEPFANVVARPNREN